MTCQIGTPLRAQLAVARLKCQRGAQETAGRQPGAPWGILERSAFGRAVDLEFGLKIGLATPRQKRIVATGGAAFVERLL